MSCASQKSMTPPSAFACSASAVASGVPERRAAIASNAMVCVAPNSTQLSNPCRAPDARRSSRASSAWSIRPASIHIQEPSQFAYAALHGPCGKSSAAATARARARLSSAPANVGRHEPRQGEMHVHRHPGVVGHEPYAGDVAFSAHLGEVVCGGRKRVDRAGEAAGEPVEHAEAGKVLRPEVVACHRGQRAASPTHDGRDRARRGTGSRPTARSAC